MKHSEHPSRSLRSNLTCCLLSTGLVFKSQVFLKGHRIRSEISSSNFPRFDRNLNNGGELGIDPEIVVAQQTIYHDDRYPSHILLPVIPPTRQAPF